MQELITTNYRDYKSLAIELANNPGKLEKIKDKIKMNRFSTPLFNTKKYTACLESQYTRLFNNFKDEK